MQKEAHLLGELASRVDDMLWRRIGTARRYTLQGFRELRKEENDGEFDILSPTQLQTLAEFEGELRALGWKPFDVVVTQKAMRSVKSATTVHLGRLDRLAVTAADLKYASRLCDEHDRQWVREFVDLVVALAPGEAPLQ